MSLLRVCSEYVLNGQADMIWHAVTCLLFSQVSEGLPFEACLFYDDCFVFMAVGDYFKNVSVGFLLSLMFIVFPRFK